MDRIELLRNLTLTPGISGHEHRIAEIMKEELGSISRFSKDNMGSCTFEMKGTRDKPKIMFVAHMDEIGFIVADILSNGFIKMQNIGGWNPNTILSSPMEIINSKGEKYPGIIGAVPVHFLKNREDAKLDINSMFIDIGEDGKAIIDQTKCNQCGKCVTVCPEDAIY